MTHLHLWYCYAMRGVRDLDSRFYMAGLAAGLTPSQARTIADEAVVYDLEHGW
jgi:hypothetical protein